MYKKNMQEKPVATNFNRYASPFIKRDDSEETLLAFKSHERKWRNRELELSDWIVPITDHPRHADYMAYRQALRDWPNTEDFPATRPSLD